VAPARCSSRLLLLWAAGGVGAAGGEAGELCFGGSPWRIKWPGAAMCRHSWPSFPLAPSLGQRRRRGGWVGVGLGDGKRWVLFSLLSMMFLLSMGRSPCSFKAVSAKAFSGRLVGWVVSSFSAKGGRIWTSPGDGLSGLPFSVTPAVGLWGSCSKEGGDDCEISSSPSRMRLMRPRGRRCARECVPWRWLMQQIQALELLGAKTSSTMLGGAGGRRCPSRKKTQEDLVVISSFLRVSFVIWGCTVLYL